MFGNNCGSALHTARHGVRRSQDYRPDVPVTIRDYKAAKRISQYINGIRGFELNLTPGKSAGKTVNLESYSDLDFAGDKVDRQWLTGGAF